MMARAFNDEVPPFNRSSRPREATVRTPTFLAWSGVSRREVETFCQSESIRTHRAYIAARHASRQGTLHAGIGPTSGTPQCAAARKRVTASRSDGGKLPWSRHRLCMRCHKAGFPTAVSRQYRQTWASMCKYLVATSFSSSGLRDHVGRMTIG